MPKFRNRIQKTLITLVITVAISSFGMVGFANHAYAISGQSLIILTNAQRSANGLSTLAWNAALSNSAYMKAQDMCAKGYWAHTAPDGATPWTFISRAGYPYITAGENLAKGFTSDDAVIAAWMASPGHRANILNPAYLDIGAAAVQCTFDNVPTTIVVAHYGATRAANQPTAPAPKTAPRTQAVAASQQPKVASQPQRPVVEQSPVPVPEPPKPAPKPAPKFGEKLWNLITEFHGNPLVVK